MIKVINIVALLIVVVHRQVGWLKKSASVVLGSSKSSTYPEGTPPVSTCLRPCWTEFLSILCVRPVVREGGGWISGGADLWLGLTR
jgi:hypothetical protein